MSEKIELPNNGNPLPIVPGEVEIISAEDFKAYEATKETANIMKEMIEANTPEALQNLAEQIGATAISDMPDYFKEVFKFSTKMIAVIQADPKGFEAILGYSELVHTVSGRLRFNGRKLLLLSIQEAEAFDKEQEAKNESADNSSTKNN